MQPETWLAQQRQRSGPLLKTEWPHHHIPDASAYNNHFNVILIAIQTHLYVDGTGIFAEIITYLLELV